MLHINLLKNHRLIPNIALADAMVVTGESVSMNEAKFQRDMKEVEFCLLRYGDYYFRDGSMGRVCK